MPQYDSGSHFKCFSLFDATIKDIGFLRIRALTGAPVLALQC